MAAFERTPIGQMSVEANASAQTFTAASGAELVTCFDTIDLEHGGADATLAATYKIVVPDSGVYEISLVGCLTSPANAGDVLKVALNDDGTAINGGIQYYTAAAAAVVHRVDIKTVATLVAGSAITVTGDVTVNGDWLWSEATLIVRRIG